jgi:crotonobetainyl-CoA:carnitine CoA-transferase CaiB-like acyl-CoA transferase
VQALENVRVVEMATVLAGPGAGRYLADYGADVIKVEAPTGDGTRGMGWRDPRDDETFMWKLLGRNKRAVVLDLKSSDGLDAMLQLLDGADVLIENGRPGTLERLGLDPDTVLWERNPGLVVLRVTGFGQTGPYRSRPGFATLAEAMGGFAAINGEPDGPPLLPPIALTDEITALVGAFATMVALHHRDRPDGGAGAGQVVDVNLLESMLQTMGPLPAAWADLGELQPRLGSGIPYSVPRGTYRCADGVWVALSTSAESVAHRLLTLLGVGDQERFRTFAGRVEHREELDHIVADWIAARPSEQVLAEIDAAEAAVAPVYSMADLLADPHIVERESVVEVDGSHMQAPVARLSGTPGEIRHAGRPLGADTEDVLWALAEGRSPWRPRPEPSA